MGDDPENEPIIYRTCGLPVLTKRKCSVQLRLNGDTSSINTNTTAAIMRRDAPPGDLVGEGGDIYSGKGIKFAYEPEWSMEKFLVEASTFLKLVLDATRVFSNDGEEITGCLQIVDGSIVFLSIREDYVPNFFSQSGVVPAKVGHFTVGEDVPYIKHTINVPSL